ncbi:MAG: hypothetical protein R6V47_01630 [Candidatus Delongbacteria bacterium]
MKKNRPAKKSRSTVILKSVQRSLSFVKGTPVLPVVSKSDVADIIVLLEELKEAEDVFENIEKNK